MGGCRNHTNIMGTDTEKLAEKERELKELQEEFDEFQASSKELEAEISADLDKAEEQLEAEKRENERLREQKDSIQTKLSEEKRELVDDLEKLKSELAAERKAHADLKKKHQALEQQNDQLERKEREQGSQVETQQGELEEVIEQKVMLETKFEETVEEGREKEQRLRDEIRDLSSELSVTKAKLTPRPGLPVVPTLSFSGVGTPATPVGTAPFTPGSATASPLSTRGLAVIGDMLQRVKDMEERLAGCRSSLGQMLSERKTPTPTKGSHSNSPVAVTS